MRANRRKRTELAIRILAYVQGFLTDELAPAISLFNLYELPDRCGNLCELLHIANFLPRRRNLTFENRMKYKTKERHGEKCTNARCSRAAHESVKRSPAV